MNFALSASRLSKTIKSDFIVVILLAPLLLLTSNAIAQSKSSKLKEIWEDQTQIDSIRFQALEDYYEENHQSNPDSALASLDIYYQLAKEKNATRRMYRSLNRKANIYRLRGEFEKSKALYMRAGELSARLKNPVLQAIITGNLGNIYLKQQDYQKAAQHYTTALSIFQEEKDEDGEARMLSSLGSVNFIIGNQDIALEYYQKSIGIYEKQEDFEPRSIAIATMNIGLIEFENEQYKRSKSSFEKALKILEIEDAKYFKAGCYSSLAVIHLKLDQVDTAALYAQKNLSLNEELKIQLGALDAEILIAQVLFRTDVNEATEKAENLLAKLPEEANHSTKKELYELLYECYKSAGKFDLSLTMLEEFTKYQDSIQLNKNSFAVVRELVRNDHEAELNESRLIGEKEKEELKNDQSKKNLFIVSASVLVVLILLFYFITKGRKNQLRRNELLEEIKNLKANKIEEKVVTSAKFELSREKLERAIERKLNETDWKVLTILLDDPVISNKEIADKAFMSVDGIGSSLRRMYEYFAVKESKYKKISLLLEAVKISNQTS